MTENKPTFPFTIYNTPKGYHCMVIKPTELNKYLAEGWSMVDKSKINSPLPYPLRLCLVERKIEK